MSLLLVLTATSQNYSGKVWKFSRLFCQDQDQDQDFFLKTKTKTKTKTLFLSSRRLETKTLVSRTTSLIIPDGQTESIIANTALCIASYADAL